MWIKKITFLTAWTLLVLSIAPNYSKAQILDSENKITVVLKDKTTVTLYGQAATLSDNKTKNYYYLPCNLRLSKKPDGTPQFLFLKFTSDERNATGVTQGGLLHLLMEYGLTKEQERELAQILNSRYNGAVLMGAANVEEDGENSVRIISATLNTKETTRTLVFNGKAPTLPGSKIAVAGILDKQGAQIFSATLERARSISDLSINLSWQYTVRIPAARGYIRMDWSKLDSLVQKDSIEYEKKRTQDRKIQNFGITSLVLSPVGGLFAWFLTPDEEEVTYDEMRKFYQFLEEKKVVTLRFEENYPDERVDKIREAFFQHFLNTFTQKQGSNANAPGTKEKEAIPDVKVGDKYKFKRDIVDITSQKVVQEFDLSYALAIKRSFQLTENFAAWYDQHKDNSKCVGIVNLGENTFQYRDINVILDLEAEEMLGKEVNYVTVNIRKRRSEEGANDFQTDVTFDRRTLEKEGNRITVSYSKAQDQSPEEYEYKVQWSLRGGMVYPPADTVWKKGSWQGLSLAPPIMPNTIRFEANLEEMKEHGIVNATLQLRYLKFNKEVETTININAGSGESFIEKMIFMDRNSKGYAYRYVFYDKAYGPLATEWDAKAATGFFYAIIPKELRDKSSVWLKKAVEAAKFLSATDAEGAIIKEHTILERFRPYIQSPVDKK